MNDAPTEALSKVTLVKMLENRQLVHISSTTMDGINPLNHPHITCSTLPLMDDATARDN